MFQRGVLAAVTALILILGLIAPVEAADPGDETVDEQFRAQQNQQEGNQEDQNEAPERRSDENQALPQSESSGLFLSFLKLIFALLLVLGLIYILYHFIARRTRKFQEGKALENLGGVSVGANRSIQLIRVGSEVLVIGVGDTVQLLKVINDPEEIGALSHQEPKPDRLETNLKRVLNWTTEKTLRKQKKNPDRPVAVMLKEKLEQLKKERSNQVKETIRKGDHDE